MPISKAYAMALDLAQMQVSTGVLDYNTAIRNAIRSVAKQGVSTVIGDAVGYDSGYRISVRGAAKMCVLTGVNQMAGNMNRMVCDELDKENICSKSTFLVPSTPSNISREMTIRCLKKK